MTQVIFFIPIRIFEAKSYLNHKVITNYVIKMKLYNMDIQEWRKGKFERGASWRSDRIYECEICHTKTNKWIIGGALGTGPRILCPGDEFQEHDELESSFGQYQKLNIKIKDFEKTLRESSQVNRERAQDMINHLYAEKELLEAKGDKLRKMFSGRLDDIEGLDSKSSTE